MSKFFFLTKCFFSNSDKIEMTEAEPSYTLKHAPIGLT